LLIEEQRTNLLLRSEEFDNAAWSKSAVTITSNTLVAPDNTLTADKLNTTTANTFHFVQSSNVTTTAVVTTVSMYVKSGGYDYVYIDFITGAFSPAVYFNLNTGAVVSTVGSPISPEIKSVGNGWYRCSFSFLAVAGASYIRAFISDTGSRVSFLGDGYSGIFIWGAQLEAGAFPTSYIKTVASQVTRAADSASMTGTNFSDWYRADEGSFYLNGSAANVAEGRFLEIVNVGNSANDYMYIASKVLEHFVVFSNGVSQVNIDAGTIVANTPVQTIASYQVNNFAACVDGGTVGVDTLGILPAGTMATMRMGFSVFSSSRSVNGTIKKIAYYPVKLEPAQLQALTS